MIQATMNGPFSVTVGEAEVPSISGAEVLLRIKRVGVCGSDMQMYHGKHKYATFPVVIGHEACGVIEEIGADVKGFVPGDKVAVQPQLVCGSCYPCLIGRMNVCENLKVRGVHADGFAAEFVAISPGMLHLCPNEMPFDQIVLAEPVAVGVGCVRRGAYKNANIAVLGAGIIGNLIAQTAQQMSGRPVLIADIQQQRLDLAAECGIAHTVNLAKTPLKDAVSEVFGSRKADIIIDAAATRGSFQDAIAAARPSSEVVITGNYKEEMQLEVPLIQRREVNLIGHMMYTPADFARAIESLASGSIKTGALVTGRFPLREMAQAIEYVHDNPASVMKVIMEV
ncbi:MAG: alcohol dehydrogenase catalytic domain-containing protein [Oscillospiraceae bacterium]|nr:alcohol dehydrogenase catalytic domain-containing protein [Oscillospiraceae bacterium]